MTRNVKRFLAVSLLSLTPSIALAEQLSAGDIEFLSGRTEYVSLRSQETVQLPQIKGDGQSVLPNTTDTFYIANWTGASLSPGYSLTGFSFNPGPPPNPLLPSTPPSISGVFGLNVPGSSLTQVYYYTTDAANPGTPNGGTGKTCRWQLNVTLDPATNTCSGTIGQSAFGTATCGIDTTQSFVDAATCRAQVVTIIQ